jgi:hypothetical protein
MPARGLEIFEMGGCENAARRRKTSRGVNSRTMDQSDPAYQLAQAASQLGTDDDALDKAIARLRPSATDIARAYARSFYNPFGNSDSQRQALAARLQVEIGATLDRLNRVLIFLTVLLVLFGIIDLVPKAYAFFASHRDSIAWAQWADHWNKP